VVRRSARRLAAALAGGVLLAPVAPAAAPAATPPPPREHEVKAAFLYHFAQLVDWPEPARAGEPFVVAVVGADPFGPALDQALDGKAVRGRPIEVRRYPSAAAMERARPHVLFAGGDDAAVERALAAVEGQPVLTVGEIARFAERGGIIGFRMTPDGRVGFDINLRGAERAGLRMRSQLLKLARIVGDGR
jgi:hypothetical protein